MKHHIILVVWGKSYVDFFLRFTIPNHLSAGNLSAFTETVSTYKIYTHAEDAVTITTSSEFKKLSNTISTKIITIDNLVTLEKYSKMTLCHKMAIKDAENCNATLIFLPPDVIFAANSFQNLLCLEKNGTRVIMIAVPRVDKTEIIPQLEHTLKSTEQLTISPRSMVEMALPSLHPVANSLFYDTKNASQWPSQLYFNVLDGGLIAHCFHLHPILVRPRIHSVSFDITIDGDYLLSSCPDSSEISVITDSDIIMAMEPCDDSYGSSPSDKRYSIPRIARWAAINANKHHRYFFTHKICFHSGSTDTPEWDKIKTRSDLFTTNITTCTNRLI